MPAASSQWTDEGGGFFGSGRGEGKACGVWFPWCLLHVSKNERKLPGQETSALPPGKDEV